MNPQVLRNHFHSFGYSVFLFVHRVNMLLCNGGVGAFHRGWWSDSVKSGLEWCRALLEDTRRYRPAWRIEMVNPFELIWLSFLYRIFQSLVVNVKLNICS